MNESIVQELMYGAVGITVAGLIYDFVGVFILGWALFGVSGLNLRKQAGTRWGMNPDLLTALVKQKADALIGLPLIGAGFALQAVGALRISPLIPSWSLYAALGLCLIGYFLWRPFYVRKKVETLKNLKSKDETDEGDTILKSQVFS